MNVLILGYGQTGQQLATLLTKAGHRVTAVSRQHHDSSQITHLAQDIRQLQLDDNDYFEWIYIILAPKQRRLEDYQNTFVDTVKPIWQALKGHPVRHVVFVSSTRVYGENNGQWINDETIPQTIDPYGQCLIEAEQQHLSYWQEKLIIMRPSGLYTTNSQYLVKQAEQATEITTQHWTNRIHRTDFIHFLHYLISIQNPQISYLLSDERPVTQGLIWQIFRARKGLTPLSLVNDSDVTGKRIKASHLQATGYQLQYPSFIEGYGFSLEEVKAQENNGW